jgi:hypothetical protein
VLLLQQQLVEVLGLLDPDGLSVPLARRVVLRPTPYKPLD